MAKDKCVLCGDESNYDFDVPVDMRIGYVEGAGQLCSECYWAGEESSVKVPSYYFRKFSNDMELGRQIRTLYNQSK